MPALTIDGRSIDYHLKRSERARRLRITVRPSGVEVVAPNTLGEREIAAFLDQHRPWIGAKVGALQDAMATHQGAHCLKDGVTIPFRGETTPLSVKLDDRVHAKVVDGDGFQVLLPRTCPAAEREARVEKALVRWLKRQARDDAAMAIEKFGPPNDLSPNGLMIKDQKNLWGSCTASGVINLNWRLILAPMDVFDYVVIHELCHLRHRHHQPPFWHEVEAIMPDFGQHRTWLKRFGHTLTLTRA